MKYTFIPFNIQEVERVLDTLNISKVDKTIVTKVSNVVKSIVPVSDRYEIFDFSPFAKNMINSILENNNIALWSITYRRGVQQIILLGDTITLNNGDVYRKSFYILNSSDKTRVLNVDTGLYNETTGISYVLSKNNSIRKKHVLGVTNFVNLMFSSDFNVFDSQVRILNSLIGKTITISSLYDKLCNIEDKNRSTELRWKSFLSSMVYRKVISNDQKNSILENPNININIDAYQSVFSYLRMFSTYDSYVIRRETERILSSTTEVTLNKKLEELLCI